MNIGIMGGTFNPIHNGHIAIAKAAYEQFHLDEVWFMPNHIPAYKSAAPIVSGDDRRSMTELAIQEFPYFRVSDVELRRDGKTYTYETMELLHREFPDNTFFFIMGADSLFYFDKWRHPERILRYARVLVAKRDGKNDGELLARMEELAGLYECSDFGLIKVDEIVCSSSEIRNRIANAEKDGGETLSAEELQVSPKVLDYIRSHHLYREKEDGLSDEQ